MSGTIQRDDFLDFALRVALNDASREDWDKYAVTHYLDDELEQLRAAIVRVGISENAGEISECGAKKIRVLVHEFKENAT